MFAPNRYFIYTTIVIYLTVQENLKKKNYFLDVIRFFPSHNFYTEKEQYQTLYSFDSSILFAGYPVPSTDILF